MSALTVGGVVIPVAVSSPVFTRSGAVDRGRVFDNSYFASQSGGAANDWQFSTPPVTPALAATYKAALGKVNAQLCSGDILELPTMCFAEWMGGKPVRKGSGHLVVVDFQLHESQGMRVLLRYYPGDTITGESFSRSTTATYYDSAGVVQTAAINVKRDVHYIPGSGPYTLLEGPATNDILQSADVSTASWTKVNMTVSAGVADPAGGTNARTITATAGNAYIAQLAAGSSSARTGSVWLRRRTGTGDVSILKPDSSGWGAPVTLTGAWQRFAVSSAASTTRDSGVLIVTNGDAVDVWGYQLETGSFATSYIPTTTVAVARGGDTYTLPFTTPPQEMTIYAKFVELGTLYTGVASGLFGVGASVNPAFMLANDAGLYSFQHRRGSDVSSRAAASPAIGQVNELHALFFGDGSVQLGQSIAGANEALAGQSAAILPASAWNDLVLTLNSRGAGTSGFTALQSLKIVAGSRSLDDMRAI